ncbi:hypothetical protein ACQP04_03745 [Pseudonocardia halophobica]|uniref:sunset domain-containing protein n=1 Tax=Pseudonocardia halophobica TaxID=29401 RepID=UPI003D8A1FB6
MADRRNRRRRAIVLFGVAGAAGAGAWAVWRRSGGGRSVRDQWARAVATPSASAIGAAEPVAIGSVNGSAGATGSGVNGSAHNGRAPQGLLTRPEAPAPEKRTAPPTKPAAEKPEAEKPGVEKPGVEKPGVEKPAAEKLAADKPAAEKRTAEEKTEVQQPATSEEIPDGPYGPGSAAPLPDGSAPSPEFTIKGNATSMLFHPPSSPYFGRTKPAAWFRTAEDAERAGFTEWKPKPRAS